METIPFLEDTRLSMKEAFKEVVQATQKIGTHAHHSLFVLFAHELEVTLQELLEGVESFSDPWTKERLTTQAQKLWGDLDQDMLRTWIKSLPQEIPTYLSWWSTTVVVCKGIKTNDFQQEVTETVVERMHLARNFESSLFIGSFETCV